jgi:CCR4-NOT transcription complex subunit 3
VQEEDFDEDEGIYDDLNLDEEEEKFGLALDDDDSDESEIGSEGKHQAKLKKCCS